MRRIAIAIMMMLVLGVAQAAAQGEGLKKALDKGAEVKAAGARRAGEVAAAQKDPKAATASGPQATASAPQPAPARGGTAAVIPGQRDPFLVPVKPPDPNLPPPTLPPGKRGLVIGQANLQGVAKSAAGMIAVVITPNGRVYFLRENDQVFNGRVLRITMDSLVFEENVIDQAGNKLKREVVKRLAAEAG